MEIKKIKICDLKPAGYNPRKRLKAGDSEYTKIKRSIEEYGYVDPVIINSDMTIIGGHQRVTVLEDLGYKEIECVIVEVSKEKEKALNLALNKISGEWDDNLLKKLLKELSETDIDMNITGFDMFEIDSIINKTATIQDIDELLNELDTSKTIEKPIWVTIRTDICNKEKLEKALLTLENNNIRVERSYEK